MLLAAALALSLPLHFEPNLGQAPDSIRYVARTSQYTLFLSDTAIAMRFPGTSQSPRMNIPRARLEVLDALAGTTNYYSGADPSGWHTNVPNYTRAVYHSVFPGVDLVIYGKTQQVEYDWVVAPGADPASIRFSFSGASRVRVNAAGDLVLDTPAGEVRHRKPDIYQKLEGRTERIDGRFAICRDGAVRFRIGAYDKRLPLAIDPKLVFAAGFGGSGISEDLPQSHYNFGDTGTGIAVDGNGNTYVAGTTFSTNFSLVNSSAAGPTSSCQSDCVYRALFVTKLSADGASLLYSTYIAAPSESVGRAYQYQPPLPAGIALGPAGNVFVTGSTSGANFPLSGQVATAGGMDAFIVELDTNGRLLASTLIGGSADDAGTSLALGPDGYLYLAGTTSSPNFPTTAGAYNGCLLGAAENIFTMKFGVSPSLGSTSPMLPTVYSACLGQGDSPAIGADSSGNAYVAASTTSEAWSTTPGAVQPTCAGPVCADVILLKLNAAGSELLYATYFGGSGTETLGGLAMDASGDAYVTGTTASSDFPTTSGVFQAKWNPGTASAAAAFAAKFTSVGKLSYATYLAGTAVDHGYGIAVDSAGNAYMGGETYSADFPIANAIQVSLYNYVCPTYSASGQTPNGETYCASAGFLTALNASGTGLLWSTYLGEGAVWAVTPDTAGNVYATGTNIDFPASPLSPGVSTSVGVLKIAQQGAGLQFSSDSIVNGASFHPGLPSAGGLASIFVHGLDVSGTVTPSGNPPLELAGVSILVNGVPAPILAVANLPVASPVGQEQINFQAPFQTQSTAANLVEVRYQGLSTFSIPQTVAPGIFLLGDGTPAIQHSSDYSLVTASNPARKGEVIIVYMTGLGAVSPSVATGIPATGPASAIGTIYSGDSISLGTILYAGLTPGYVGLYQMNVRIADNAPSGNQSLYVYWPQGFGPPPPPDNLAKSNIVTLPIQ